MGHLKQFEFLREMDEMVDWIQEKEVLALSEDYGKDLEHVEVRDRRQGCQLCFFLYIMLPEIVLDARQKFKTQ